MKKIMRLLFLIVLVFPLIINADTYKNEVANANNLIKQDFYKNTYEKYILFNNKTKYEYSNEEIKYNSSFKTGGFISKDEYELTKVKGLSYLLNEISYWTLTKDKKNVYVITTDDIEIAKNPNEDYFARVTEYVRPKTVVSGSGTQNDPWQFDPMYKVSVKVNSEYAKIVSGNDEYVKGNCKTEECTSNVKITGSSGYRYLSNDCGGVYDIKTQTLSINNVRRNIECNVEYSYGLFNINITGGTPETFYAIYGDNFYTDINSKSILKSLDTVKTKKGYTFTGYKYEDLQVIDGNKKLIKESLNGITKDITMNPSYEANIYTVTYNCNGGYDSPKNQSVTYDSKFNLTSDLCKREGYIQNGWNAQADGEGLSWNKQNRTNWTWNIDSNVTLYAIWRKCAAGTYSGADENVCTKCEVGNYSLAGAGKCSKCPDGYTSEAGADKIEKCYINVEAGKHLATAKTNKSVECPNGQFIEAHTVHYGDFSTCIMCPTGYGDGDSIEYKTEQSKCVRNVSPGYYVAVAKSPGNTVCPNGYYKEAHQVRFGESSTCDQCPTGYRDGSKLDNKTEQNKCLRNVTAGYYIATSKSINNTLCPNGQYSTTHSILYGQTSKCTSCPEGYRDGRKLANKTSKETCLKNVPAGSYVAYDKDEEARVCANGFYKEAHTLIYGQTSKCSACPEGYRDGVTVSNKTAKNKCLRNVSGGYYIAQAYDVSNALCEDGYYREKHGVTFGSTSSCSQCPEGYRDGKSATNKSSKESCTRIVDAGYYIAKANDTTNVLCENGYYKGTHNVDYGQVSTCNICPDGYRNGTSLESKTAENRCVRTVAAGYYIVGAKATNDTECPTGYYKTEHNVTYGSVSRCLVCPSGYRNGTNVENKKSVNSCIRSVPQNHYIAKPGDDKNTACPSGTTKKAHNVFYGDVSSCS